MRINEFAGWKHIEYPSAHLEHRGGSAFIYKEQISLSVLIITALLTFIGCLTG